MSAAPFTPTNTIMLQPSPEVLANRIEVILQAGKFLFSPGDVVEIRIPDTREKVISGYSDDLQILADLALRADRKGPGVYWILNRINPALKARAQDRLKPYAKHATGDTDVLLRRRLLLDVDSIRASGISATDAEHQAALDLCALMRRELLNEDWPEPLVQDSGNGGYLIYGLPDLPNDDQSTDLVKRLLIALGCRFNTDLAKVDESTFNASRIAKIPGTTAAKGDDTTDRPYRVSRLLDVPDFAEPVRLELLERLAALADPSQPKSRSYSRRNGSDFNLDAWILKSGLSIKNTATDKSGGRKFLLADCPFQPNDRGGNPFIAELPGGALVFKCFHGDCEGNDWGALRTLIDLSYGQRNGTPVMVVPPPGDEEARPPHKQAPKKNSANEREAPAQPIVMNLAEVMAQEVDAPSMLVEKLIPEFGATLISGPPKSNKTLLAVQMAVAVASGRALLDYYRVLSPGAVMVVEQDDPAGGASIKDVLQKSLVAVNGIPFHLAVRIPFSFGLLFLEWLEREITTKALKLVVLDSYTALRGSRGAGIDIVKAEQMDMTALDELGKCARCAILVIHHDSKGSKGLEWTDQTAGTFAMTMATEALIHVCRFPELDSTAPEPLIQARGRHDEGVQTVVRFRKDSLDHEHVLSGGAAPFFPLLVQLRDAFGTQPFSPKDITHETGVSRSTAHRQITRLYHAGALKKGTYGEYVLTPW